MAMIGVKLCDFCGKRYEEIGGWLTLKKAQKRPDTYQNQVTVRSWTLCQKCLAKLTGVQTTGDVIKEHVEVQIDAIRAHLYKQRSGLRLLDADESFVGKKKIS